MKNIIFFLILSSFLSAASAEGKKKVTYRKTQEVNFEDANIDGKVNSPDGAYLAPKRGVKFLPLYKVNDQFEKRILSSVEYL
jgi:hypothetical protein